MASAARAAFVRGVAALETACDVHEVRSADPVGDLLRKGLTISAFNLLEGFISDRLTELAAFVNGGATQFTDLPDALQRRAIVRTIEVARGRVSRGQLETPELRDFSRSLGASLHAVDRSIALSPFTWLWSGSNLRADDFQQALRLLHVEQPWNSALGIAGRLGFETTDGSGAPLRLSDDLDALVRERHKCAHDAGYGVSTLWLRAVPKRILRLAIPFDVLASVAAERMRSGDPVFLSDANWMNEKRVELRFVRQRTTDFAESRENARRASFRDKDGERLFAIAESRCAPHEALVMTDRTSKITAWSIPVAG